jgi:hypothetical protein
MASVARLRLLASNVPKVSTARTAVLRPNATARGLLRCAIISSSNQSQKHLFLEQAEGYVKAPEKSTSWILNWREVFEHCTESYSISEKSLKVVLKVLSFLWSDKPSGT